MPRSPLRVVVMGVSGCGKSTIGEQLATALQLPFVEGDRLHPPRNVALMASGTPLTDHDRQGWLERIAGELERAGQRGVVISCSALKRRYRDRLRTAAPDLRLVHLHGSPALLAERLQSRAGHYMPPSLLQSQLDTLEAPQADEHAIAVDVAAPPAAIVGAVQERLLAGLSPTAPCPPPCSSSSR